jgi:hypothetical protein
VAQSKHLPAGDLAPLYLVGLGKERLRVADKCTATAGGRYFVNMP